MKSIDPDWIDSLANGLSSGEGLIERLQDDLPMKGEFILHQPLKRLMLIEEELSRPITSMRRESNTLSPILRSAWDCNTLSVMTRGKSQLKASNAYVSIVSHITPDELRKLLSDSVETTNGFSNRFLWLYVRASKLLPHGGNINVIDPFIERLKAVLKTAKTIGEMQRSPEAKQLWEEVYPKLKRSKKGAYGRTVDRACPQVVRLSMIYALLDGSSIIEVEHLRAALAVWRYCDRSTQRLFSSEDVDPMEQKIIELLEDHGSMTKTEIRDSLSSSKNVRKQLNPKLEELTKAGRIEFNQQRYSLSVRLPVVYKNENGQTDTTIQSKSEIQNGRMDTNNVMTLDDLLLWRNNNELNFVLRENEETPIWVSSKDECLLTEAVRTALRAYQSDLELILPKPKAKPEEEDGEYIDPEVFYKELESGLKAICDEYKEPTQNEVDDYFRRRTGG